MNNWNHTQPSLSAKRLKRLYEVLGTARHVCLNANCPERVGGECIARTGTEYVILDDKERKSLSSLLQLVELKDEDEALTILNELLGLYGQRAKDEARLSFATAAMNKLEGIRYSGISVADLDNYWGEGDENIVRAIDEIDALYSATKGAK